MRASLWGCDASGYAALCGGGFWVGFGVFGCVLGLPPGGEEVELVHEELHVGEACGGDVGDLGWVGGADAAFYEAALFQGAEAHGKETGGDAGDGAAEGSEAHGAVAAEEPEDVQGPGAGEHIKQAAHAAADADLFLSGGFGDGLDG